MIACTLVWTTTQIVVATRTRQPIFDLPSDGQEASVDEPDWLLLSGAR